jgi:Protein of unknown function (DUF1579)
MRNAKVLFMFLVATVLCGAQTAQTDDPTKKLGALVGQWQTEGTLMGSVSVTSNLQCRWSPQGSFLVCEQLIKMGPGEHRQLTVYSYNAKEGNYVYTTLADPGAKPTTGTVEIKGNVWTYASSVEAHGKTTQVQTINEFTDAKTEVFKVASSDDGGAHWVRVLEGKARKIAD